MDNKDREILKLRIKLASLKGVFRGVLTGITCWKIPIKLKHKIEKELQDMTDEEYPLKNFL